MALRVEALGWWYQWRESCKPNPSWQGIKNLFIQRFHPTMMRSHFELLLALNRPDLWTGYHSIWMIFRGNGWKINTHTHYIYHLQRKSHSELEDWLCYIEQCFYKQFLVYKMFIISHHHVGDGLSILRAKLRSQKKLVKHLKKSHSGPEVWRR